MTKEEAIEILKAYRSKLSNSVSNQLDGDIKAFDIAINSLEIDERYELEYEQAESCDDWHDVPSDKMTLEQARKAVKDLRKKLAEYLEDGVKE